MPSRIIAAIDAHQRRHRWLGFPLAVVYKFADDQGPYLAALIAYYGFLSLFPLLLLMVTVVLGAGVIVTTGLSGLTTAAGALGATFATWLGIAAIPLATVVNVALFLVAFRVLTASQVPWRQLRVGAVVAGIGWEVVQMLGTYLVTLLKGAPETYGVFGLVLGAIAWIYLLALVVVLAAEINVVAQRRLWPRALLAPFTDQARLTPADRRAYAAYAQSERHKGFEVVDVGFDQPAETGTQDGAEQP